MERFDLFESWWAWLTDLRADQPGLTDGNVLHGVVTPPALHRMYVDVRLLRCEKPRLIEAAIEGDFTGPGVLRLSESAHGTSVEVTWSLTMQSRWLRVATQVAYPLMRSGHDHLIDLAVSRFRSQALSVARSATSAESAPSGPRSWR